VLYLSPVYILRRRCFAVTVAMYFSFPFWHAESSVICDGCERVAALFTFSTTIHGTATALTAVNQRMAEDSLSRRLAGQSVNKAGLGNDQTEINRIIMESSKGSKFYEAERKKDAELTEKINRLLAQKDSMMSGVDIGGPNYFRSNLYITCQTFYG